ncbi:MAG TPA: PstS family phosphate ABC transporter substrate-binding protein [Fimbriimonadales bacterium]|nr:PstS family phosphate ABC transporter substrate-binding protein [Fimbriimonadales bacterium]
MNKHIFKILPIIGTAPIFLFFGCQPKMESQTTSLTENAQQLSGTINIDGSSTVAPVSSAVAEEFANIAPNVKVVVKTSGTGGGFKKFVVGEIDISDASRPIEPEEIEKAKQNGIEFIEIPIGYDGLSVVVNPKNTFVDYLTVEELKRIWEPGSKVKKWSDVRPTFPNKEIKLYGPGRDSGTFDYFCEAILKTKKESRQDYQASEDDNFLVTGVSGDPNALGYFGYAYYEQNKDKLRVVPIDNGKGPVAPSPETVQSGEYQPLSRPLFIYVSKKAAERPEVKAFVEFYLSEEGRELIRAEGYMPLPDEVYAAVLERFRAGMTGSVFEGIPHVGADLRKLYAQGG